MQGKRMAQLADNTSGISRPPTTFEKLCDVFFRSLSYTFAWLTVALVVFIIYEIAMPARPALQKYGLSFIWRTTWDQDENVYGILPQIWGTFYSSFLALVLGSILGLAVAIFLSERFLSSAVFQLLKLFGLQYHPFWKKLPEGLEDVHEEPRGVARGHSQRGLWVVGGVRHHPFDSPGLRLASRQSQGRSAFFHNPRAAAACCRPRSCWPS